MKDVKDRWCVQIDVTNACEKACSNCTHLVKCAKPWRMDLAEFKRAVDSMEGWPHKVGIIGGNPMLHPDVRGMVDYVCQKLSHEARAIWISTFGKGGEMEGLVRGVFAPHNIYFNDHEDKNWHQPVLAASRDLVPDKAERDRLIDECWVAETWSPSITPKGCYRCEVMGAFDMALGLNLGLPVEPGWWRRPMADFKRQVEEFCPRCGLCVPMWRRVDSEAVDDVSESNMGVAVPTRSKRFDVTQYDQNKVVDWFPKEYRRETKKLWGITVSVGYGGCLERTLEFNSPHMEKILVVSAVADEKTREVCSRYPNVELVTTGIFYEFGATFNKGAAVEMATWMVPKGEWCLIFDADICLPRDAFLTDVLDPQCLYGATRAMVYTDEQFRKAVSKRNFDCEGLEVMSAEDIPGFFQLFNTGAEALSRRPWYGVTYGNASWCDCDFVNRWNPVLKRKLGIKVLHLGEKENWDCMVEGTFPRPSVAGQFEKRSIVGIAATQEDVMLRVCEEVGRLRRGEPKHEEKARSESPSWKLPDDMVSAYDGMKVLVLVPMKPNLAEPLKSRCLRQLEALKDVMGKYVDVKVDDRGKGDVHIRTLCERVSHVYELRQELVDECLKPEHTHVLWVDADIRFDVQTVAKMMEYQHEVVAPMVVYDGRPPTEEFDRPGEDRFYDVAGFIEDGRWTDKWPPFFRQSGPVVQLDCVGAFYMVPADLFRAGARYYPVAGYTEHYSVCEFAKRRGRSVLCDTRLKVYHPCLKKYGEVQH